jgi:prepilin-type processing-associated H-X9-DG protein
MATIGIMAAIAVPVFNGVAERAKSTKDLINLRQIGIATQLYMNDNNGVLFSTAGSWMSQLYNADNPATSKYISSWNIFVSPFDHRPSTNPAASAVSYGINGTPGVVGMSADRISNPTAFIVFAPTQTSGTTVTFQGSGNTTSQATLAGTRNVTVVGATGTWTGLPNPPGSLIVQSATAGTHSGRTKINAVFADWHVETMAWSAFKDTAAPYRWSP